MKEINFEFRVPVIRLSEGWAWRLKITLSILIVVVAFVAKQNQEFTFFGTLILAYAGISLLWNLASRIAAVPALFFLASCLILLVMGNEAWAETSAAYAYYFLVITVVGEMAALLRAK